MEVKYQNSAGRLLVILQSLNPRQGFGQQLIPVFLSKDIPGEAKDISIECVKALAGLHILYAKVLEDLNHADMNEDERAVLIKGLASLQNLMYPLALTQNPRQVSESEIALLELFAAKLPREKKISDTDLTKINDSIGELKSVIDDLSVSGILRNVLLELVRLSEDSISRYNIYGAEGLKRAFKDMLAEVAEIYIQNDEPTARLVNTPAWKKAESHIKLFDKVAAKILQYGPVLEKASQLLLGNDNP